MATPTTYDSFWDDVTRQTFNSVTASYKCMLVTAYTPNKGTHTKRSDVTSTEITGTGYTAGGATVTCTVAKDTTNHRETWTFSNPSWTTATISAAGAVVYNARGGASSADELVCYVDFGGTIVSTAGTFAETFTGALTLQN